MTPIFFTNQEEFRLWLEKNHQNETELLVGFFKVDSKKPSMNWSQSVDQALCFGFPQKSNDSLDYKRQTSRNKTFKTQQNHQ